MWFIEKKRTSGQRLNGRDTSQPETSLDILEFKASEATTDHKCEELAVNAKESLVGLYVLDNGHIHR